MFDIDTFGGILPAFAGDDLHGFIRTVIQDLDLQQCRRVINLADYIDQSFDYIQLIEYR